MAAHFATPVHETLPYNRETIGHAIKNGTVMFVATHGLYNHTISQQPFIVPSNTIVIELQQLGDLCMTYSDGAAWVISQGKNRGLFIDCLLNGICAHDDIKTLISHMIIYGPGDSVPIRTLTISGSERLSRKTLMGIYKLNPGDEEIPYSNASSSKTLHEIEAGLWEAGRETTNEAIIKATPIASVPNVFLFLSCAASTPIEKYNIEQMMRWERTASLQTLAKLRSLSLGIGTLAGGPNAPSTETYVEDSSTNMRMEAPSTSGNIKRIMQVKTAGPRCANGYSVILSISGGVIPLYVQKAGETEKRFCLTDAEVKQYITDITKPKPPIYSIIKYNTTGDMIEGKIMGDPMTGKPMGGGYRRTLRNRKRRLNKSKRNRGNARR